MKTLRLAVNPQQLDTQPSRAAIEIAAGILRDGGLVAFPTETVYGLGANALDPEALKNIFEAKQRPSWDPLIVHIADRAMLPQVVDVEGQPLTSSAEALLSAFWPGPLTALLPRTQKISDIVTAGRPLVGVRMPSHPVAKALIAATGVPIAAPSANRFGRISPTQAAHVLEDLDDRIDAVLDAGETAHGLESTVVDASQEPVLLYRPGMISLDMLREVCGSAIEWKPEGTKCSAQAEPASMVSPGLGIRHYAPRAPLLLIDAAGGSAAFLNAASHAAFVKRSVGLMLPGNYVPEGHSDFGNAVVFNWGDWADLPMLAHRLFAGLRQLDSAGVDLIVCPLPSTEGIGAAIRDRLLKAARKE